MGNADQTCRDSAADLDLLLRIETGQAHAVYREALMDTVMRCRPSYEYVGCLMGTPSHDMDGHLVDRVDFVEMHWVHLSIAVNLMVIVSPAWMRVASVMGSYGKLVAARRRYQASPSLRSGSPFSFDW
jgi:hypothetical protein